MYNIKEAASRSGVSVPTLRAWERRYGVVTPARTPSGYRLYDDQAIERLRRMRKLLSAGWRPREAAGEVLRDRRTGAASEASVDAGVSAPDTRNGMVDRLVASAVDFDSAQVSAVLDEAFARASFEIAMEEVVFPALREVGRRWEQGTLSVAAEHAVSNGIQRRLAVLYEAARRPGERPQVIIGLPPDARHDLGALAFAVALRRVGLDTLYLGSDVPIESWVRSLRQTGARLAVIGAVTGADVDAARATVGAISEQLPQVVCFLGGDGAAELADAGRVLSGVLAEDARLVRSLAID
ncbi:MAG TPA: MerR family transcriptional regulator [Candidatus Limnocylindrales bacterium]|nr:MerR family transcriptional regulator [Candidatus Limnocylindrales bacterium]